MRAFPKHFAVQSSVCLCAMSRCVSVLPLSGSCRDVIASGWAGPSLLASRFMGDAGAGQLSSRGKKATAFCSCGGKILACGPIRMIRGVFAKFASPHEPGSQPYTPAASIKAAPRSLLAEPRWSLSRPRVPWPCLDRPLARAHHRCAPAPSRRGLLLVRRAW